MARSVIQLHVPQTFTQKQSRNSSTPMHILSTTPIITIKPKTFVCAGNRVTDPVGGAERRTCKGQGGGRQVPGVLQGGGEGQPLLQAPAGGGRADGAGHPGRLRDQGKPFYSSSLGSL